jgi:membrane peptidoglycan carboxypeptidase
MQTLLQVPIWLTAVVIVLTHRTLLLGWRGLRALLVWLEREWPGWKGSGTTRLHERRLQLRAAREWVRGEWPGWRAAIEARLDAQRPRLRYADRRTRHYSAAYLQGLSKDLIWLFAFSGAALRIVWKCGAVANRGLGVMARSAGRWLRRMDLPGKVIAASIFIARGLNAAGSPSPKGMAGGVIALAGATALLLPMSGAALYSMYASDFVPPERMAVNRPLAGANVLDRNGNLLYQFVDHSEGLRYPVELRDISPHLIAASIATEDANFFDNSGINTRGLLRAAWENLNPLSGEFLGGSGGSSITQQLVKNVYFPSEERTERRLARKAREVVYALEISKRYSKEQVLAWYLNEISYGRVFYGVEAASQAYFSKPSRDLTLAEAALLAGLPQAPALYDPLIDPEAALQRRNQVLDLLARQEEIEIGNGAVYIPDREEIEAAKASPIEVRPKGQLGTVEAPHFVFTYVKPQLEARFGEEALYRDGLVVTTSLDLELQKRSEASLEARIQAFEHRTDSRNGAVIVIDPRTGEVLAMVGSRDYFRDDIEGKNNNLLAPNSPGSAFKPFVYLATFLKHNAGPGSIIVDSPVIHRNPDGSIFQPRNPTGRFHGPVTVRAALGNSLNIPAFRAAEVTGVHEILSLARNFGFTDLDGSYGPAIALGGVDLKAIDLAFAYTALANGGVLRGQRPSGHDFVDDRVEPIAVLQVTNTSGRIIFNVETERAEKRVAPEEHVFLINHILSDPGAQCMTFGCGALSIPGRMVAVKTGTSEPYDPDGPLAGMIGETWAFGYTPDIVVGVWAGNTDNSPARSLLSTSIAFPAMRDVLLAYFGGRPSTPFQQPPGIVRSRICVSGPDVPRTCVDDLFLRAAVQGQPPASSEPAQPAQRQASSPATQASTAAPQATSAPRPTATPRPSDDRDRPRDNRGQGRGGRDDD